MRLRGNEFCPIQRSVFCCGREQVPKVRTVRLGVQRVEDPHHPRGYRELRSPAEMRKLLKRKVAEQNRICAICQHEFTDYHDVVPDHKNPNRDGRSLERRPSRQHPGSPLVLQLGKGVYPGRLTYLESESEPWAQLQDVLMDSVPQRDVQRQTGSSQSTNATMLTIVTKGDFS